MNLLAHRRGEQLRERFQPGNGLLIESKIITTGHASQCVMPTCLESMECGIDGFDGRSMAAEGSLAGRAISMFPSLPVPRGDGVVRLGTKFGGAQA